MNDTMTSTSPNEENDPLIRFRTAWLRAVAMAWMKDEEKQLIENPKKMVVGFPEEWDRLDLVVRTMPDFLWVDGVWTWEEDANKAKEDELSIWLPLFKDAPKADRIPEPELALALADYYRQRPSIFSKGHTKLAPNGRIMPHAVAVASAFQPEWRERLVSSGNGPVPGGLVPNGSDFASFMVALLSSMAKAWTVEHFARRLTADPEGALALTHEYTVPWKLKIKIYDDPGPKWLSKEQTWDFTKEHSNRLALWLPQKPESGKQQALALAAYNATGAEYPFTCCV